MARGGKKAGNENNLAMGAGAVAALTADSLPSPRRESVSVPAFSSETQHFATREGPHACRFG